MFQLAEQIPIPIRCSHFVVIIRLIFTFENILGHWVPLLSLSMNSILPNSWLYQWAIEGSVTRNNLIFRACPELCLAIPFSWYLWRKWREHSWRERLALLFGFVKQAFNRRHPSPLLISWKVLGSHVAASGCEGDGGWSESRGNLENAAAPSSWTQQDKHKAISTACQPFTSM